MATEKTDRMSRGIGDDGRRLVGGAVAAVLAEEGHPPSPDHVGRGHEGGDQAEDQHQPVGAAVLALGGPGQDLVLGPEPGEGRQGDQGGHGQGEGPERAGHVLAQPAHLPHVEGVVGGQADRAGAQEQAALEEGVGEQVEHATRPGADAQAHDHVAELGDGRVGQHPLDVGLHEGQRGPEHGGEGADEGHVVQVAGADVEPVEEDRVEPGDQVDAGHHHGGGVDEGRHRRGTGHGVGQPGVQRELARLGGHAAEQAQGPDQQQRGRHSAATGRPG